MNALEKLKRFQWICAHATGPQPNYPFECALFMNTHGPALVELIETAQTKDEGGLSRNEYWKACERYESALRKLTEDKS